MDFHEIVVRYRQTADEILDHTHAGDVAMIATSSEAPPPPAVDASPILIRRIDSLPTDRSTHEAAVRAVVDTRRSP